MATNTPHQPVTKSWVHEPERVAAERTDKFRRLTRMGEVPTIVGGLALILIGRRVGGSIGRAIGAMGATLSMTAGGSLFNRYAVSRLRGLVSTPEPEPIPS